MSEHQMIRKLRERHGRPILVAYDGRYHIRLNVLTVRSLAGDTQTYTVAPLGSGRTMAAALRRALEAPDAHP